MSHEHGVPIQLPAAHASAAAAADATLLTPLTPSMAAEALPAART